MEAWKYRFVFEYFDMNWWGKAGATNHSRSVPPSSFRAYLFRQMSWTGGEIHHSSPVVVYKLSAPPEHPVATRNCVSSWAVEGAEASAEAAEIGTACLLI